MKYGNLCIAAHNYNNGTFFSDISKLKKDDTFKVYDNYGNSQIYKIEKIYKTKQNDTSCTNQDTNNLKIVTLITCDNINDNFRTIVKAIELN